MRTNLASQVQSQLVAAFAIISDTSDMTDVICHLRDLLSVDHLVYHSSKRGSSPSIDPYIRLTYPSEWIKRYLEMNYVDVDPVLREGFTRTLPFDWSELAVTSEKQMAFMMDALAHGVGPNGLSIPVMSEHGHRGLVSISDARSPEAWQAFRSENLSDLIGVANRLHRRVVHEIFGESRAKITPREIECLRLTAVGKDSTDIAIILNISPYTARDHLKSARFKLDCATSAQAVTKAISLGLLVL
jgi:DNA-binding CsgD family transcriptional regulator